MNQFAKRGLALLMAIVMCISLLPALHLDADAASYVYNWGVRGVTAEELSASAENFYSKYNTSYAELASYAGGTSASNAPSSDLYRELHELMANAQSYQTSYDATKDLYQYTDCQNGGGKISSFYSGKEVGPGWGEGGSWNREHTWPNSKGDKAGNGENDIMMLRPADSSENSSRGNKAYGESSGYYNPNSESNSTYDLRGDVARIMLYVYVRWECTNTGSSYNPDGIFGTDGVIESLELMLRWIEEDPVDTWELGRNDSVESITGTRNVFVDYPELAFLLFGEEVPVMTTPSGESEKQCGHNNFDNGVVTPASCTAKGYTTYTCQTAGCDYSYKAQYTAKIPHVYENGVCECGKAEPSGEPMYLYYPAGNTYVSNAVNNGKLSASATPVVWNVEEDDDGYYIFSTDDGLYMTSAESGGGISLSETLTDCARWEVSEAAGGLYLRNVGAAYNGTANQYLEYYNYVFTTYGFDQSKTEIYTYQLIDANCQHTNTETWAGYGATCAESGLTDGVKCADCGMVVTARQEIPATGEHVYVDGFCACGKAKPAEGETEVTISFTDVANRTEQDSNKQVWQQNGITVTNNKSASTTNVANYSNPARFYKNSELIIAYPGMTKIVFECASSNSDDYASYLVTALAANSSVTATKDGTTVTVVLSEATNSFTIALSGGQVRVYSLTVFAGTAGGSGSTPDPDPDPTPDPNPGEPSTGVVDTPVAGTAYKFGMIQGNVSTTEIYYLAGGMDGYYLATTTDENAAIDVYLEETAGGYYFYTMNGATKQYINMVVSGTHVNGAYETTASTVYTWDAENKTIIAQVNDEPYWFGTRNDKTYTTVGPCATSYNGFFCQFYGVAAEPECEHTNVGAWESDGTNHWKTCECGEIVEEGQHNEVVNAGAEATCTEPGWTDGTKCSVCDKILTAREEILATGHRNTEVIEAVAATRTTAGSTAGILCTDCDTAIVEPQEIAPLGYSIYFVVPEGVDMPAVTGMTQWTAVAPALVPEHCVFVGWITTPVNADWAEWTNEEFGVACPEIYEVGDTVTLNADLVLYALYKVDPSAAVQPSMIMYYAAPAATTYSDVATVAEDSTTVKVKISEYAAAHSWTNGTKYPQLEMDSVVTVTISGSSPDAGKYYTNGNDWRTYQSNGGSKITVSAADGATINTVKFTYNTSKNGVLKNGSNNVSSNATVTVNAPSIAFTVGNTGSATNGQVKITAIEVTYTKAAGACDHSYVPAVTDEASCGEPGVMTYTCSLCGDSYTEAIDPAGHNYVDGICSVCGAEKPAAYEKITSLAELTTGSYVLIVNNYALEKFDGSSWVLVIEPTMEGDAVADPKGAVWTITVTNGTATLKDANGKFIAPLGDNENGIKAGEYSWAIVDNGDGTFSFKGQGSDTVILAANNSNGGGKVRAYKTSTVSSNASSYPSKFSLYKQPAAPAEPECDHQNTTLSAWVTTDETNHWKVCECGAKVEEGAHSYSAWNNGVKTCTCGKEVTCNHTGTTLSAWVTTDDTNHWKVCECGLNVQQAAHSYGTWNNGVKACTCGKQITCNHTGTTLSAWQKDETNHWKVCECGVDVQEAAHSFDAQTGVCECGLAAKNIYTTVFGDCAHANTQWTGGTLDAVLAHGDKLHTGALYCNDCQTTLFAGEETELCETISAKTCFVSEVCSCGKILTPAGHVYDSTTGICSDCGDVCQHSYENSVCTICFHECKHDVCTNNVCDECESVMVAKIGDQYFATIQAAVNAAEAGDTIVLLADVTAGAFNATGLTIDLNGHKLTADIAGTIKMNGGTYATSQYVMVGVADGKYTSQDAIFTIAANMDITFHSGTITLNEELWYTLEGQTIAFEEDATFVIPAEKTMYVNGSIINIEGAAENYGTLLVTNGAQINGTVTLCSADAIVEGPEGLDVITLVDEHKVVYEEGVYKSVQKVYVAQIGDVRYESLQEAFDAANDGDVIVLLMDVELSQYLDIYTENAGETAREITLDLNDCTISPASDYRYTDYPLVFVGLNQTLNIVGEGKITAEKNVTVGVYGVLNIEGGIIENTGVTEDDIAVHIYYWEGGNGYDAVAIGSGSISGGTIVGGNYAVYNEGALEVTGGEFVGNITNDDELGASLEISGGSFTVDVSDYCADGFTILDNGDGTFGVVLDHVHQAGKWTVAKEPTCSESGMRVSYCECGLAYYERIPATGKHNFGAWTVTKEATCTVAGQETRKCACGEVETRATELAAHTEVVDAAVAATCTATGLTAGKHCDLCNEVLVAQEEVAAAGHKPVAIAAVAPTCTTTGLTEGKRCSACDVILAVQTPVAALGHTEVVDAAVAPTCTEKGMTEGRHCSVCNAVLVAQYELAANGHYFGAWTVTKEATRQEAGQQVRSCSCGATETSEIPVIEGVNPIVIVVAVVAGLGVAAAAAFIFLKRK